MSSLNPPNPKAYAESIRRLKRQFTEKKCLAPFADHAGNIIAAHTLSIGSMLKPIARDGHVYTWGANFYPESIDEAFNLELRGLRETSVFNGFCSHHDNLLFKPIDDEKFLCSPEQLFLHAYRAIAKESYAKFKQFDAYPNLEEWANILAIQNPSGYTMSPEAALHFEAVMRGAEDAQNLKEKFDSILINKDFRRLVTHVLPFRMKPGIVCNSILAPDSDFDGNELQNFERFDVDLNHLTVTIIPDQTGGYALLSYLDNRSEGPAQLVASLLKQNDLTSALMWLIIGYFDNMAFAPDWWDQLPIGTKDQIVNGFRRTLNPFAGLKHRLVGNPLKLSDWQFQTPFQI